ncbi:MAG: helix-turn-helix transcriptional regulator [Porphyromonas sp.]|nr:helix-turn-helix transcriptional regulator [Porphyromonas sp.]
MSNILDKKTKVKYTRQRREGVTLKLKIKEIREAQAMSQMELSIKSGVSRQTISDLERGDEDVNTTTITLQKLASALNCTVSDFI